MMRHGGERYRVGVSGDTVVAEDTVTSTVHAYRKRKIEDGTHQLGILGSVKTANGRVVGVSKPAEATGYTVLEERGRIFLSRKSDPRWRIDLSSSAPVLHRGTTHSNAMAAIVNMRNRDLCLLAGDGMFRLVPIAAKAAGDVTEFHLGGDFSP